MGSWTFRFQLAALITRRLLAERAEWRAFIESLGADCEFLHRDQFHARFPDIDVALAAIFRLRDGQPRPCADATAIGACGLADLRALILRHCAARLIHRTDIQEFGG